MHIEAVQKIVKGQKTTKTQEKNCRRKKNESETMEQKEKHNFVKKRYFKSEM